jgi:outer membrane protein OmpA-like peptidoglycan-associated protein
LAGRDITFVLTPTTGKQQPLRQPQVLYREKLLTAITKAAGAGNVEFIVGEGGLPAGTSGDAREVPIPHPPGTINGKKTTFTDRKGTTRVTTKCVIPSPMLFEPDSSVLLEPEEATTALAHCIRHANSSTRIRVDGHTSCRNASDSDPAVAAKLSITRAKTIGEIAVQLGVRRSHITTYGWGDTKPLKKPCSDQANRASVVTITTIVKEPKQ